MKIAFSDQLRHIALEYICQVESVAGSFIEQLICYQRLVGRVDASGGIDRLQLDGNKLVDVAALVYVSYHEIDVAEMAHFDFVNVLRIGRRLPRPTVFDDLGKDLYFKETLRTQADDSSGFNLSPLVLERGTHGIRIT